MFEVSASQVASKARLPFEFAVLNKSANIVWERQMPLKYSQVELKNNQGVHGQYK